MKQPLAPVAYPTQEAHRIPNTREHCRTALELDTETMLATCPACGASWQAIPYVPPILTPAEVKL